VLFPKPTGFASSGELLNAEPWSISTDSVLTAFDKAAGCADAPDAASREAGMADKFAVHDPRGYPPKVEGKRLAPRLPSLDGKTVYLVDCLFDNSDVFMQKLHGWFGEHLPAVNIKTIKPRESWVDDPGMRAKIAEDGDAAILGVGL
jgi:hypothetical protein